MLVPQQSLHLLLSGGCADTPLRCALPLTPPCGAHFQCSTAPPCGALTRCLCLRLSPPHPASTCSAASSGDDNAAPPCCRQPTPLVPLPRACATDPDPSSSLRSFATRTARPSQDRGRDRAWSWPGRGMVQRWTMRSRDLVRERLSAWRSYHASHSSWQPSCRYQGVPACVSWLLAVSSARGSECPLWRCLVSGFRAVRHLMV